MSSLCFETLKTISSLCDIKWLEEPLELGLVYFLVPPFCETSVDAASVNKLKLTAWNKYMIGLTAMSTGHFKLASDIFEIICNYKFENDQHYKWIQLLIKICQNEAALMRMNCDNNDMELSSTITAKPKARRHLLSAGACVLNIPPDMASPHCAKCISSGQMFTVHLEGQFNEGINKKLYTCANKVLVIVTAATPVDIITLTEDESARNGNKHKMLNSEDIIYSREVAVLDGCFSTYLVFDAPPLEIIPMKSNGAGILSVSVHLLDGDNVFKLDVGDANRIYYKFVDEIN
ncbi:hypothetical protein D917_06651 [Trichinella nativa]|uniref:Uncharacterized protein n=1 Tax=Trichinella nativa TaxID=6335 RepID=A0A1Y3EVE1_9BILA|nr:hypothetical protein D917_06651 [Trichinella nativa]